MDVNSVIFLSLDASLSSAHWASQVLRETVNSVRLSCDMMVCCGMNTLSNGTAVIGWCDGLARQEGVDSLL